MLPLTRHGLRQLRRQTLLGTRLLLWRLRCLLLHRLCVCLCRWLVLLPVCLHVLLHSLLHLRLHGRLVSVCLRHRLHAAAAANTRVTTVDRWQPRLLPLKLHQCRPLQHHVLLVHHAEVGLLEVAALVGHRHVRHLRLLRLRLLHLLCLLCLLCLMRLSSLYVLCPLGLLLHLRRGRRPRLLLHRRLLRRGLSILLWSCTRCRSCPHLIGSWLQWCRDRACRMFACRPAIIVGCLYWRTGPLARARPA